MSIKEIFLALLTFHKASNVPTLEKTSVVSDLYPGQFNYCLDERHWLEQYGDITNVNDDHFQKIQPAIRLADFENCYVNSECFSQHLGAFTISTVSGGHVVPAENGEQYYRNSVNKMLSALDSFGLARERLRFSYFAGGVTGRDVEASRKTNGQMQKIMVDDITIPEDRLSFETLQSHGITGDQLIPGNTWTNYLAINWYACVAPWGYRNEIFYQMDDGILLDIATIEHLDTEPITEGEGEEKVIIGTRPWRNHIVIDGLGLERIVLATCGQGTIMEVMGWSNLMTKFGAKKIQAVCILHRIFTDCSWDDLSHSRKKKASRMMGYLSDLSPTEIEMILVRNTEIYQAVLPDLGNGIAKVQSEIVAYRQRRKLSI